MEEMSTNYSPPSTRYNCAGLKFGKVDVGRYSDVSQKYVALSRSHRWSYLRHLTNFRAFHCPDGIHFSLSSSQVQGEYISSLQAAAVSGALPGRERSYETPPSGQKRTSSVLELHWGEGSTAALNCYSFNNIMNGKVFVCTPNSNENQSVIFENCCKRILPLNAYTSLYVKSLKIN